MPRVRVKIEGMQDVQTALEVVRLGADAVGFVFADSPRRVTPEQAAVIIAALPPFVATVGVFVNESPQRINETVAATGIEYVQLHGDEGPQVIDHINAKCLKAFRIRDEGWINQVGAWLNALGGAPLGGIVLDAYDKSAYGGTGKKFNWNMVAEARAAGRMDNLPPIILAGGLGPDCVAEAIKTVRPHAVDVASGVESSPGQKDLFRVTAFIDAVARTMQE